jgi:hypothetical protein
MIGAGFGSLCYVIVEDSDLLKDFEHGFSMV